MANQLPLGIVQYNGGFYLATLELFDAQDQAVDVSKLKADRELVTKTYRRIVQDMLPSKADKKLKNIVTISVQGFESQGVQVSHQEAKTAKLWCELMVYLTNPELGKLYRAKIQFTNVGVANPTEFKRVLESIRDKKRASEQLDDQERRVLTALRTHWPIPKTPQEEQLEISAIDQLIVRL